MSQNIRIVFYRVFSVLTMGQFLLPIVFENLFFPLDRKYFYSLGWLTSTIVFYPRSFLRKRMFFLYFAALWYFFFITLGLYKVDLSWIRDEFEALFFSFIMLQYFLISKDYKWVKTLLVICLCFISITFVTTLVGLQLNPLAAREIGGILQSQGDFELISYYRSKGIAGYDFFYGLAFFLPCIVLYIKLKGLGRKEKIILIAFVLFSIFSILRAQFTTAFIFSVIGVGIAFWTDERIKPALMRLFPIILLIVFFPQELIADVLYSFASLLDDGTIKSRLTDLSLSLKYGVGSAGTHIDFRFQRIPFLLNNFIESPLFGGGESLAHNWWFDRLSLFGLSGVIPWFLILWNEIRSNLKKLQDSSKIYYLISIILFILMGLIKNMGQQLVMIFVFFLIPLTLMFKGMIDIKAKRK
jgi:hypothetical protein